MTWDCLLHNALVLTMEPGAAPIFPGYVAIRGEKIAAVGKTPASQDLAAARQSLDVKGALVGVHLSRRGWLA
jgi:predicted amidohydrolase YtcJ